VILPSIETPADLEKLTYEELDELSEEIRQFIIETVTNNPPGATWARTSGWSNSPWRCTGSSIRQGHPALDTGHQAYVHKLLTAVVTASRTCASAAVSPVIQPLGEPARLDRVQSRLHGALVRARTVRRTATATGADRPRRQAPRRGGRGDGSLTAVWPTRRSTISDIRISAS